MLSGTNQDAIVTIKTLNLNPITLQHSDSQPQKLPTPDRQHLRLVLYQLNGQRIFPPIGVMASSEKLHQTFCAGQRWHMRIDLRPMHSQLNSGGFDGQRWAVANRFTLSGRIRFAELIDGQCSGRQTVVTKIQQQLAERPYASVIIALAFGDMSLVSTSLNQALRNTATAHLMAIAGLHIGIAALIGWLLARGIQRLLPPKWIDYRFPIVISWMTALYYTWLSGMNPPAVRAILAISVWIMLRLLKLRCHSWQVWLWVVTLLLLGDPLAVISDSFWLSCFAVAGLIFWFQWVPLPRYFSRAWYWGWVRWIHLEVATTILLFPMQIGIFHGINTLSFFANLWAVPIVSLLTIPLILFALLLNTLSDVVFSSLINLCWLLADRTLALAFSGVFAFKGYWLNVASATLGISILGWVSVIVWRMGWIRSHPIVMIIVLTLTGVYGTSTEKENWRVDVLDVGHGLAVLIAKNGRGVLYDTGDRWETGSQAENQILPYLQWKNISLEHIVISHSDRDHNGGTEIIHAAYPQAKLHTSFLGNLPCKQGLVWHWQDLKFDVLWPPRQPVRAGNDDSCVIRVTDGKFSVLLTGDIEKKTENQLVMQYGQRLHSTVLQVPHHGSNTSSTGPFLRTTRPDIAIASASRFNVWHLPAEKVKQFYKKNHIPWYDTSHSGQLSVYFFNDYWLIKGLRRELMPRWYHQWFGVGDDNE